MTLELNNRVSILINDSNTSIPILAAYLMQSVHLQTFLLFKLQHDAICTTHLFLCSIESTTKNAKASLYLYRSVPRVHFVLFTLCGINESHKWATHSLDSVLHVDKLTMTSATCAATTSSYNGATPQEINYEISLRIII